ncbi:Zinc transporter 1-like protein [Drosera capensis]
MKKGYPTHDTFPWQLPSLGSKCSNNSEVILRTMFRDEDIAFRSARAAIAASMACSKSPRSMSQLAAPSVVFLLAIQFAFTTVHGDGVAPPTFIPRALYWLKWNESFLLLGTQFAGGVFLGTSLMHFLSDSTSTFQSLTTLGYPFSYMLACAGYLLTMLGDVIGYIAEKSARAEGKTRPGGHGSDLDEEAKTDVMIDQNSLFLKTASIGDTVLLILALCFHSVFEGIAVGIALKPNILY